jgi:hypothetical protein
MNTPCPIPESPCTHCPLKKWEACLSTVIAWITVFTGLAQIFIPKKMLPLMAVPAADNLAHLFATIGMFMVLFGGALIHAQKERNSLSVVLLWAALQKILASLFVAWGISKGVFAPLAYVIAGFDGLSGLLFFDYRRRIKS